MHNLCELCADLWFRFRVGQVWSVQLGNNTLETSGAAVCTLETIRLLSPVLCEVFVAIGTNSQGSPLWLPPTTNFTHAEVLTYTSSSHPHRKSLWSFEDVSCSNSSKEDL